MRTELYKSANADDKKPVVLVVDDEETVLETLALQLGREYRVLTAPDGDAGPPGARRAGRRRRGDQRHADARDERHRAAAPGPDGVPGHHPGAAHRVRRHGHRGRRDQLRRGVPLPAQAGRHRRAAQRHPRLGDQARPGDGRPGAARPHPAHQRAGAVRGPRAVQPGRVASGPAGSAPWSASSATSCSWTACGRSRWPRWPPSSARSPCPPATLQKLERGLPLNADEQATVDAMPRIALRLLGDIPMMEDVLAIVRGLSRRAGPAGGPLRAGRGRDRGGADRHRVRGPGDPRRHRRQRDHRDRGARRPVPARDRGAAPAQGRPRGQGLGAQRPGDRAGGRHAPGRGRGGHQRPGPDRQGDGDHRG